MAEEEDVQKMCLRYILVELLGPKKSKKDSYGAFQEEMLRLINRGAINIGLDLGVDNQNVLAELMFKNDDLVSDVRDAIADALNHYQRLSELYGEFERRYQEYKKNNP